MDSASENEDITAQFLQHHQGEPFLLSGGSVEDDEEDSRDADDDRGTGLLREQDRFLPIANVARLMKKAIPKTGKIAKDARECVQECVSEFVSFITSEASDRCHQEKRKTINGEDILVAMTTLGFDNYVEPLKLYLQKYREANKGEKPLALGESSTNLIINSVSGNGGGAVGGTSSSIQVVKAENSEAATSVVFTYSDIGQLQTTSTEPEFIG